MLTKTDDLIRRQDAIDKICIEWCGKKHKDCPHIYDFKTEDRYCDGCDDVVILQDCRSVEEMNSMDGKVILEVVRSLIGETEPYGDSGIDRKRTENLDKLIDVIDGLLSDVEKAAVNKDRHEGSMRMMGEKAHKALNDWWSWIDSYLSYLEEGEQDG